MSAPRVSVCMPASRPEASLQAAIRSVLAQTVPDLELIVTDDHGGLERLVLAAADERVRYVRNPYRLGMAGNTRAAAALAAGSVIAFLHDDDRWTPRFLERLLPHLDAPGRPAVVFSDCWLDEPTGRRLIGDRVNAGLHEDFLPTLITDNPILPSLALQRAEAWRQGETILPLPDFSTADSLIWLRLAMAGESFVYVPEPLVHYGSHEGQLSRDDDLIRTNRVRLWESVELQEPHVRQLRDRALATALFSRALLRLRQDRTGDAREDLRQAASLEDRPRSLALRALAARPGMLSLPIAIRRLQRRVMDQ